MHYLNTKCKHNHTFTHNVTAWHFLRTTIPHNMIKGTDASKCGASGRTSVKMKTIRFRKVIKRLIASAKHNVTQCNTQKHTCCAEHNFFSIPKEDVIG